jgi:hypothetical protein
MKEINRAFALKMLERKIGRPAAEIEAQGKYESEIWPAGEGEYEASVNAHERGARAIVEYFARRRPSEVTKQDVEEIIWRRAGYADRKYIPTVDEERLEQFKSEIRLVFDIYEQED